MKHIDDRLAARMSFGEASPEETREAEDHASRCARCRESLSAARATWAVLATDPASTLPDTPLWPRVAEALDGARGSASPPAIRARWRIAIGEATHTAAGYAALALIMLGLVGGNVAGRALLGSDAGAAGNTTGTATLADADQSATAQVLDFSALVDLPEGSLAAAYLGADESANGDATNAEVER